MANSNTVSPYDQVVAQQLLKAHEQGMTTRLLLGGHYRKHVAGLLPVVLFIAGIFSSNLWISAANGCVLVFWTSFIIAGYLHEQMRSWGVLDQVIDWEQVRQLANGETGRDRENMEE